jgi:hypothetical protein
MNKPETTFSWMALTLIFQDKCQNKNTKIRKGEREKGRRKHNVFVI